MIKNIRSVSNINACKIAEKFRDDDLIDSKVTREKLLKECNKFSKTKITNEDYDNAKLEYLKIINNCNKHNVEWVAYTNPLFPRSLIDLINKEIYNPKNKFDIPPIIYYKGDISPINNYRNIAVIGTREPQDYSLEEGQALAKVLGDKEVNIISGLALGCDTAGHKGALESVHKYTVAVLAGGLDKIYPASNKSLANEIILSGGCLLSEDPPTTQPQKWSFAKRDRIQSALSEGIVVIETKIMGGTMITVDFAKKQNRRILAYKNINPSKKESFTGNDKILEEGAIALNYNLDKDVEIILSFPQPKIETIIKMSDEAIITSDKYKDWTVKSLKEELKKQGIQPSSKMKKEDLIELLEKSPKQGSLF